MLGVVEATEAGFYLGLSALIGRDEKAIFGYIKSKLWHRDSRWKSRFFLRAAKEILVKIVAQALPTFLMSVFYLPLDLCAELERMLNSFWWGNGRTGDGIKWMSWERLCVPKCQGGMGFRRLHEFNLSLLGKQAWRILSELDSLASRVIKGKYYPHTTFLEAAIGNNPSYIWRSIF